MLFRSVDTRILGRVTDSLQKSRFASIGPSDYKYTKMSILCSKVIGITIAHHVVLVVGCHWVKIKRLRGNNITSLTFRRVVSGKVFYYILFFISFLLVVSYQLGGQQVYRKGWCYYPSVPKFSPFRSLCVLENERS